MSNNFPKCWIGAVLNGLNMKYVAFFSGIFLLCLSAFGFHPDHSSGDSLSLKDWNGTIQNRVEITVSKKVYREVRKSKGEKYKIPGMVMTVNGKAVEIKSAGLRGQSSLDFKRKSFTISAHETASFHKGDSTRALKKFYLISMSMDRYYYRNHMAFQCMNKLGFFSLFYTFAELSINGKTQGVYLVSQKPIDHALKDLDSPYVIRRYYLADVAKTKIDKKDAPFDAVVYDKAFRRLYWFTRRFKGEGLRDSLNAYLDLKTYMRWMAFNYLVKNGDYTDEVYFYAFPSDSTVRYGIQPWDYDDIFASEPHEGKEDRDKALGDKLIFSGEDFLDQCISKHPDLYAAYLVELEWAIDQLDGEAIKGVLENTYADLFPYYADKKIIGRSKDDWAGKVDLEGFEESLRDTFSLLMERMEETRKKIAEEEK